jgi:hypothetical protein
MVEIKLVPSANIYWNGAIPRNDPTSIKKTTNNKDTTNKERYAVFILAPLNQQPKSAAQQKAYAICLKGMPANEPEGRITAARISALVLTFKKDLSQWFCMLVFPVI